MSRLGYTVKNYFIVLVFQIYISSQKCLGISSKAFFSSYIEQLKVTVVFLPYNHLVIDSLWCFLGTNMNYHFSPIEQRQSCTRLTQLHRNKQVWGGGLMLVALCVVTLDTIAIQYGEMYEFFFSFTSVFLHFLQSWHN